MKPSVRPFSIQRRRLLGAIGLSSLAGAITAACSPVALLNGAAPSDTYLRTAGIPYGDLPRQRLDVYRPTAAVADAPTVVFFYGGAWRHGARGDYLFVGEALAALGCVAVLADYRLFPEARFPAFVEDGAAALRWARDHAPEHGGNPRRLFVMGHSAGAHIALMLVTDERYLAAAGMQPRELAGAIGLAGPYDFLPFTSKRTAAIFDPPERWPQSQPINFVSGKEPPVLLLTGNDDNIVDPGNSTRLAAKMRGLGGKVEVIRYPGEGHRSIIAALAAPLRSRYRVQDDVAAFIARQADALSRPGLAASRS